MIDISADFDKKRGGTGTCEWAEVTENIQRGCINNCLYCYAAHNANRFGWRPRNEWEREELTKRALMRSYPARDGVIMFPSTHDITPFNVFHFIRVAKIILTKGNRLLIVSKPRLDCIQKVCAALIPWRDKILFRFTIGAIQRELTDLFEPGAPCPEERLEAMKYAHDSGYAVSISIEPMLAGPFETGWVISNVLPFHPETIWIGKMNKVRLRIADKSPAVLEAIVRIETQQCDAEIIRLFQKVGRAVVVRWKDSINTVLKTYNIL